MIMFRYKYAIVVLLTVWSLELASSSVQKPLKLTDVFTSFVQAAGVNGNFTGCPENVSECTKDIAKLRRGIEAGELWALKMLDATSKVPSGILNGNIHDLGKYEQCLEVKGRDHAANIRGRHCIISVTVSNQCEPIDDTTKLIWGQAVLLFSPTSGRVLRMTASACLPSTCDVAEITEMTKAAISESPTLLESGMSVARVTCSPVKQKASWGEICLATFLISWCLFLMICTICDCKQIPGFEGTSVFRNNLAKFSLITNAQALLSLESKSNAMPALNGIRCFNAFVIVAMHRAFVTVILPRTNFLEVVNFRSSWAINFVLKPLLYVMDSFFLLSGFLRSYHFPSQIRAENKSNVLSDILRRYTRLLPAVAFVTLLGLCSQQSALLRSGPLWEGYMNITVHSKAQNWWLNLLFIQNIVKPSQMRTAKICHHVDIPISLLPIRTLFEDAHFVEEMNDNESVAWFLLHLWGVAVDMQLFCLSPMILYPLHRWPRPGLVILSCFFILSLVVPAAVVGITGKPAIFEIGSPMEVNDQTYFMYTSPFTRATPYLMGLYLGYRIANIKQILTKVQVKVYWILCCIALILSSAIASFAQPVTQDTNLKWELLYVICGRPLWSIATAWILFACTRGYGGLITKLLSLPVFLPLARLSYSMYLIHVILHGVETIAVREAEFASIHKYIIEYVSDIVLSIVAAFMIDLFLHRPLLVLEKLLRKNNLKKTDLEQSTLIKKST